MTLSLVYTPTRAARSHLHKPACVTTSLKVLDCPKARNYLLSGIWKFRNLSFPILQNSNVSFPTQATISLLKILYIESPWKLSGGKRFLGHASWLFSSWIDRTNKQTTKKFEHLAWLYKSRKNLSPDRGRLDTKEFNMARGTSKIRLYDRDVFPAATEGPANVFSSIPFLLVKSR